MIGATEHGGDDGLKILLTGGFLGAGKTTLLYEAARRLTDRGHVVGLITNDQAPDLVDTALLSRSGSQVREVAGSCFCCNFEGFRDAVQSLEAAGAQIIMAEPVGSCTDLAATILLPLRAFHPEYALSPLTVLVDPARMKEALLSTTSVLDSDAVYILRKQLEEAERILVNKADMLSTDEMASMRDWFEHEFPEKAIGLVSAKTGDGVDAWLDDALANVSEATGLDNIDYDRYARGEAVLGWLNAVVSLDSKLESLPGWEDVTLDLMAAIQGRLQETGNPVGHIKLVLDAGELRVVANTTGLEEPVSLRSEGVGEERSATLTLNARVQIAPKLIERIVRESLIRACSKAGLTSVIETLHCLQPGRPVPTHRFADGS